MPNAESKMKSEKSGGAALIFECPFGKLPGSEQPS
jgi:hypothetical protein